MTLALVDLFRRRRLLVRIISLIHLLILTIRRLCLNRGRWRRRRRWLILLLLPDRGRGLSVLTVCRRLILIMIALLHRVVDGALRSRRLGRRCLPLLLSGLAPLRRGWRRRRRLLLLVCWLVGWILLLRWVLLCTGLLVLVRGWIPA